MDTNIKINCGVLAVFDSGAAVTGDFTTDKAALETA